jgi:O-antigen/teichoic acid export membrane protein
MTAMRRNLVANFVAQIVGVLLNLACVPLFLHLLGPEQYGLVGFAVSLQAMLAVLDLGLATTANREFSRTGGQGTGVASGPVMLRTLELIYFGMGAAVALVLVLAAPWISDHWLQTRVTPPGVVRSSLVLLGLATGLRWPVGLYSGVLLGLERQVSLSVVVVGRSLLRTAGAALVLYLVGGTAVSYFGCLVVVSCLEVAATAWLAWRSQPPRTAGDARFDVGVIRSFWSFSGELTLISLFAAVLKQEDKVILGRLAPLAALGHYTVASTLSGGLLLFSTPVFTAVFPRFSSLLARGQERDAASLYHRASGLVAMLAAPAGAALVLFPGPILSEWTRSPGVAAEASGALSILAVATLLNACMQVPYALLLAAGLTRISLWMNGLGVAVLAPLLILLIRRYGIVGGGAAWALFNLAYFLIAPAILHRYVLKGHLLRWLVADTLPFYALAALCFGGAAWLARHSAHGWNAWILLGAAGALYGATVVVVWGHGPVNLFNSVGMLLSAKGAGVGPAGPARASAERAESTVYDGTGSL